MSESEVVREAEWARQRKRLQNEHRTGGAKVRRGSYLLLTDFERVEAWCKEVRTLFDGEVPYMVGSVNTTATFRDVDLRLLLDDDVYDATYADPVKVRLMNHAISTWGQRETGLPIDFQIQRLTDANEAFDKEFRNPMGLRNWALQPPSGAPGGQRTDTPSPKKRRKTAKAAASTAVGRDVR